MPVSEKTFDKKEYDTDIEQYNELINVSYVLHSLQLSFWDHE